MITFTETFVDEFEQRKNFDTLIILEDTTMHLVSMIRTPNKPTTVAHATVEVHPDYLIVKLLPFNETKLKKLFSSLSNDVLEAIYFGTKELQETVDQIKDRETTYFPMSRIHMACEMKKKFKKPSDSNQPDYCVQFVDSDFIVQANGNVKVKRDNLGYINPVIDTMIKVQYQECEVAIH